MTALKQCGICGARNGQLVWRLKSNWRFFFPGPVPGSKEHDQARERAADNQAFVKSTGLYYDRLETVALTDADLCTWCAEHVKTDPHRACPRCKPTPPPWLKVPCELCGGSGVLKGAQSLEAVVNRINEALRSGHSKTL